jgi:probable rRNA maturation factor
MNTETEPPSGPPSNTNFEELAVEISDTQSHLRVDRTLLVRLARGVLAGEEVHQASISIALVDNATIHEVNRRHLSHDWPTDVISFRLSDDDDPELTGELVVSAEMAVVTARQSNVDPWAELALYVVHGLLHLCGYDDTTDAGAASMRRREDEVLAREGLTNTFPLVVTAAPADDERGRESTRCPG